MSAATRVVDAAHRAGLLPTLMQRYGFRKALGSAARVHAWSMLGATIGPEVHLSPGVTMRHARHVTIGEGSALSGRRVWIDAWGEVTIGRDVLINEDVMLLTAGHDLDSPDFAGDIRSVAIGDHAWLPTQIILLPGTRIGRCAVVGTGSVVSGVVPDYAIVAGNPARQIGERARVEYRYRPSRL